MDTGELNLAVEIVKSMNRFDYRKESIDRVANSSEFMQATDKPATLQRTILTMLFFNIMVSTSVPAPAHIRMALNLATDSLGWLDDMNNTILPWLKANEDVFFP